MIQNALERVSSGQSLNSAAGIPETTLRRYKLKPELVGRFSGPKPLLTDEEEVGLATAALWLKECGLPLDILHLKLAAINLAHAKDVAFKATNGLPSDEWFRAFINSMSIKHGINLSLRIPMFHRN